jgi:hypothetical protein
MGAFLRWIVFLGALGWIGYNGMLAGWSYFTTQEIVDRVVRESLVRHRTALTSGTERAFGDVVTDIRASILRAARSDGIVMEEGDVQVSANPALVYTTVKWSYPLITYGGRDVLALPLSLQRSFTPPP